MDRTAMNAALQMAVQAEDPKWRLGSVLVRGGSILSRGSNKRRNDPRVVESNKYYECTTHAEINTLRKTKNPVGATMYIARITPGNVIALARPCNRCRAELVNAGVKKVAFTTSNGLWEMEKV